MPPFHKRPTAFRHAGVSARLPLQLHRLTCFERRFHLLFCCPFRWRFTSCCFVRGSNVIHVKIFIALQTIDAMTISTDIAGTSEAQKTVSIITFHRLSRAGALSARGPLMRIMAGGTGNQPRIDLFTLCIVDRRIFAAARAV